MYTHTHERAHIHTHKERERERERKSSKQVRTKSPFLKRDIHGFLLDGLSVLSELSHFDRKEIRKRTLHTRLLATNRTMQHNTSYTRACFNNIPHVRTRICGGERARARACMCMRDTSRRDRHNDTLRESAGTLEEREKGIGGRTERRGQTDRENKDRVG